MAKTPYLDFIKTLLPETERSAFEECYQQRIKKSIKVLQNKVKKSDFLSFFSLLEWELTRPQLSHQGISYDDVLYLEKKDKSGLGSHFLHQGGIFYVQEVAAGISAQILSPKKGDLVLDLCAAPGGKSVQLADALCCQGGGFLLVNEPLDARRKALIFNLNRCGLSNTAVSAYRGEQIGYLAPESFDKVLADVPCSGEGMNYKHDKTTSYRDARLAQEFANLQYEILLSGVHALKVGGELVYSTCTLNPLENEQVIARLLGAFPGAFELMPVEIDEKSPGLTHYGDQEFLTQEQAKQLARFRPHLQKTGGFFLAKIKKLTSIPIALQCDQRRKNKETGLQSGSQIQDQARRILGEHRAIPYDEHALFLASESTIYFTLKEIDRLPNTLFIEKVGVPIFRIGRQGDWIPQQALAASLGKYAQKKVLNLTLEQAKKIAETGSLQGSFSKKGDFLILKREDQAFALAKQGDGILKVKR